MDIRGHAGIAECAGQNGVELAPEHSKPVRWNCGLVLEIAVSAPIKIRQLDRRSRGLDDLHSLWNDIFAYAIAGDDCDFLFPSHGSKGNTGAVRRLRARDVTRASSKGQNKAGKKWEGTAFQPCR